ncbi:maleylpyruvate isomerase family mycothiol-dependent enzyme [Nocardioides jishulii]|uniref:Maleylpyruvate isomerase family mycothiol-dependent enzyme n=1 Tax=Nocardioides jishulii TaxID=2575440 RepID=A0A4U2YMF4_9ACTN|nr:maleylpyruvate isomerase family mycothiol-dependent enzyme [Nocardioides jishulii]QCX27639.1 maleylpyruvate isomerase family mycothiol-dependent enzyme [Nocardioides jishulii]TKI62446.1 maleylpyruvate isomerase family mycothiol-dependent enzyme [Nocardioides jishulii]
MDPNEKTLTDFRSLLDEFSEVVARANESWDSPSPCEGWTSGDVLDHVIDSERDFFASHDLALGARPTGTPEEVWRAHVSAVNSALTGPEVLAGEFDGFFGRSTIGATLATFFNLDLVIHRWDLASALGTGTVLTDHEMDLAESALDTLGDAIYAHGACAAAVDLPADATRQVRLIARTGRDPRAWSSNRA